MASEEVKGSFYRYDFWVITAQLATGAGALERELLVFHCMSTLFTTIVPPLLTAFLVSKVRSFCCIYYNMFNIFNKLIKLGHIFERALR